MILWLIVYVILFVTFVLYEKKHQLYISSYIGLFFKALFWGFVYASILGWILNFSFDAPNDKSTSIEIYSADMNSEIHGNFILGTGAIDSSTYYYYYENLSNGNKKLSKIKTEKVQIKLTDDITPQIITHTTTWTVKNPTVIKLTKPFNFFYDSPGPMDEASTWYELVAPKNAITKKIDLNIN